jgi:hypothetical protein
VLRIHWGSPWRARQEELVGARWWECRLLAACRSMGGCSLQAARKASRYQLPDVGPLTLLFANLLRMLGLNEERGTSPGRSLSFHHSVQK